MVSECGKGSVSVRPAIFCQRSPIVSETNKLPRVLRPRPVGRARGSDTAPWQPTSSLGRHPERSESCLGSHPGTTSETEVPDSWMTRGDSRISRVGNHDDPRFAMPPTRAASLRTNGALRLQLGNKRWIVLPVVAETCG